VSVEVIRADALADVPHGFLGRRGGVSTGVVAGLNVGTGSQDDPSAIAENRRRAIEAVQAGGKLATVYQVHSAEAVYVTEPWPHEERPVLFADAEAGVVGAAHAGWRGAVGGVTDSAIAAMEKIGARRERIVAAVGPCIAQASYEVDEGFRSRFLEADGANGRFFIVGPAGKPHFDLEGYVAARLRAAGLGRVETLGLDTYADTGRFFSFRRSTHRGEPDYGRQISLVALPA
jgi:hypothetical protein